MPEMPSVMSDALAEARHERYSRSVNMENRLGRIVPEPCVTEETSVDTACRVKKLRGTRRKGL
jgi:hypothetical protein